MRKVALLTLSLAFVAAGALAGGSGWQTDYEKAVKKAKKAERPILVEFTDGEASKTINKAVFHTAKFKSWARKNVVLLELNYSKKLSRKLSAQYDDLKRKYEVKEFPTVLLLGHDGKLLGRPAFDETRGVAGWIEGADEMASAASSAGQWITDFKEAKKLSKRTRKPMLVDFNGSDW